LKTGSDSSPTEAGRKPPVAGDEAPVARPEADTSHPGDGSVFDPVLVDAINQVFSEFAFAYHNQFHKAFPDQASVAIGKEYWLSCLAEFSPVQITRAARQLVKNSEFLPNVAAMVQACRNGRELFGLPTPREAYLEACRAPSPKAAQQWSHPAVYHAGRASDWYVLASEPESVAYPIFEYNYRQICQRVMQGERLDIRPPPALTSGSGPKLSARERKERMRRLREEVGL